MNVMQNFSNFIFGMECLGCGSTSEQLDPWLCPKCRTVLENEAKGAKFPNEDTVCLFPMRSVTRKMIHGLKYKNLPGVASYLVRRSSLLGQGIVGQVLEQYARPFFFVPVPLHRARLRERGYNQAEKIAAALAAATGGRLCRWLERRTFVVSQTKLSKEEREWNVAGAFVSRLPKRMPSRGTVFVVDDVFTTGATTAACLGALGGDFPLNRKVCTLLYEEPATATMDFVADMQMEWDFAYKNEKSTK